MHEKQHAQFSCPVGSSDPNAIKKMLWEDLIVSVLFLTQTGIGILGNSALMMLYVRVFTAQPRRVKPTDLIITHLTVANTVTLLTQVVPGIVLAFRWEDIMDVIWCQIFLYTRRVARGLSICTTCLLITFQAVTISPSTSCWARLKPRTPRFIFPALIFSWILCLLLDINILRMSKATKNAMATVHNVTRKFCAWSLQAVDLKDIGFVSAFTLRDAILMCLMGWSSGYMVMVLHQHRKQVQHIHSTGLSPKSSPKSRATQTILVIVSCFVSFYCINSGTVLMTYVVKDTLKLYDPATFLGSCFASICPLVLISNDPWLCRLLCVLKKPAVKYLSQRLINRIHCNAEIKSTLSINHSPSLCPSSHLQQHGPCPDLENVMKV
ncbi:vomeronasal type-1 receptor 4-like [Tachyglossus aculeatus]|uniref:vomeronasal type-1 receptor 4-like n=1 Tax=Tachyglossus aculeatus TaxID=9261 RepID=UPI0018F2F6DB|nr:vomeronasal type-1 receptor 4-like [Tachyglossus aculeatus]